MSGMSGPGEPYRPGAPAGAGPWDTRSEAWLTGETGEVSEAGETGEEPAVEDGAGREEARSHGTGGGAGDGVRAGAHAGRSGTYAGRTDVGAIGEGVNRTDAEGPADDAGRAAETAAGQFAEATAGQPTETAAESGTPGRAPAARPRTARPPATPRRAGADPVKTLIHRHRELCERAVDPLEIAAGLEAHGLTDRTAARFRHRDVFSLAEEMYARVAAGPEEPPAPEAAPAPRVRADWAVRSLLPGALATATVAALHLTHGRTRLTAAAVGVLAVAVGLRAALRHGPLGIPGRAPAGSRPAGTGTCTTWLLAYALLGDGLLRAALAGGPHHLPDGTADGPWPLVTAPVLALALACAPAAWCAHLLTAHARRRLAASRNLEDFTAGARPLLLGTVALFLGASAGLLALCAAALDQPFAHTEYTEAYAETLTLGALLLLARLLVVHGFAHAPAVALTAAAAAEATALAVVFAARLPGCAALAVPVRTVTDACGTGAVPTLACGAAALALLLHASRSLTRASAHTRHTEDDAS
ncbi:hypothetical protein ACFOOM_27600 [Streptomyces echinoruber]|uniref:Integral membrane protein n=1 Tax=Streptomyces echinoruber TaxID=68898 RepID=A0A918QZ98_9ACTN|nr:hypothetical protein [Streptomyces echinoruber]GGZ75370.1 hypothetical protein GCM10010389_11120 [Streptomyces echinoruber]